MSSNAAAPRKTSQKSSNLFATEQKSSLIAGLLLALGTLVLYNPATHFDFINFDDDRYVFNNPYILQGLSWKTVVWAFRSTSEGNWHPITWLSHAFDYQLFGLNPAGHHYMSVLLHVCNVVLLFVFLNRATQYVWRSFMVAALLAVHPINVESVAWVAERKNVLCTLFFMLALLAYLAYTRKPSLGRYLTLLAMFALGLMAKPMVITLPFVLLLLDYWPLARMMTQSGEPVTPLANPKIPKKSFAWLVLEKVPMLALVLGSALITLFAQGSAGAVSSIQDVSLGSRIGNAVVCYLRYIEKAVVPVHLASLYPYPVDGVPTWRWLSALVVLLCITAFAFLITDRGYLKTGWLWFLGTLIPVIGLVQIGNQAMADRYAYIPFIGLFIMAVWGIADLARQRRISSTYLAVGATVILAAMSVQAEIQMSYWRDGAALWAHTAEVTANNFIAEDNLGNALILEGKKDEALPHFQAALRIRPSDPVSELDIGIYAQMQGHLQESMDWYRKALVDTTNPDLRAQAYTNLGSAYRMSGNHREAKQNYQSSLQLNPNATLALIGLGLVSQKTGDLDLAIQSYEKAVAIQPTDVDYLLLAQAWQLKGDANKAQEAFHRAETLTRNMENAQMAVGHLLSQ